MFPELTTERFLLQQILPEDQQFIFEGLSHPDIIPFYGVRYDSFEATKKQMEWYDKSYDEGTGGPWKIVDKTTGEKLGVVAYYYHKVEHKKAEVGFWLFPQYWNKGVTTEVLKKVIELKLSSATKEIILVDDGSTDRTVKTIEGMNLSKSIVKFIKHAKNSGKGAAVRTGIKNSSGDYIIIQDADLEYDLVAVGPST